MTSNVIWLAMSHWASHIKIVSAHITDINIYETIEPGINKLVLTSPNDVISVFKVVVFIEYEYLSEDVQ